MSNNYNPVFLTERNYLITRHPIFGNNNNNHTVESVYY